MTGMAGTGFLNAIWITPRLEKPDSTNLTLSDSLCELSTVPEASRSPDHSQGCHRDIVDPNHNECPVKMPPMKPKMLPHLKPRRNARRVFAFSKFTCA